MQKLLDQFQGGWKVWMGELLPKWLWWTDVRVTSNCRMPYKADTQTKYVHHFILLYYTLQNFYMCPLQPYCSPEGDSGGLVCRCTEE